jgi:hypothetical protein
MAFVHGDIGRRKRAAAIEVARLERVVVTRLERVNLIIGQSLSILWHGDEGAEFTQASLVSR